MNRFKAIIMAVSVVLAMGFAVSCSGDSGDSPIGGGGVSSDDDGNFTTKSSSSSTDVQSSSSIRDCSTGYSEATEFCFNGKIYPLCKGSIYDASMYGCCNNATFTLSTQGCINNFVLMKCGSNYFDSGTHFCSSNVVYEKCGTSTYTPSTQGCCNNTTFTLSTQSCINNSVRVKCGDDYYGPSTQFCYSKDSKIYTLCGGKEYAPDAVSCSNGNIVYNYGTLTDTRDNNKSYKTIVIGTQTWMAENLNYDVPNNTTDVCYSNDSANCTKYGRLYNWETAMTACPLDWHLPSNDEWNTLVNFTGNILSAKSCWDDLKLYYDLEFYESSDDSYGFSALSGGYGESSGSFNHIRVQGYWWSSQVLLGDLVFLRYLLSCSEMPSHLLNKSNLLSVRCVKD